MQIANCRDCRFVVVIRPQSRNVLILCSRLPTPVASDDLEVHQVSTVIRVLLQTRCIPARSSPTKLEPVTALRDAISQALVGDLVRDLLRVEEESEGLFEP
jgi:hypothetical protein